MKKYKLINTTIKKAKIHPKTGKDLRTAVEKIGHPVKIRKENGQEIYVDRHRPRIVDEITEGMLSMHRGKYIRIEEIADEGDIWKKHVLGKNEDIFEPDELAKNAPKEQPKPKTEKLGKVAEMGTPTSPHATAESEGVNPDGDPNFLVKAGKTIQKHEKRQTARKEAKQSKPPVEG